MLHRGIGRFIRRAASAALVSALAVPAASAGESPARGRGVVLFVGDGLGVATLTAARIHRGALDGLARPADGRLQVDDAARAALVRTASEDNIVTDSAAAITAMLTGRATANGMLGVRAGVGGALDTLVTLLELAEARGLATGVVTTTRLTHATPAGCYAHVPDRATEDIIALSLLPGVNPALGDGIEVILGGGSRHFVPPAPAGSTPALGGIFAPVRRGRADARDLAAELRGAGWRTVGDAGALEAAVREGAGRIIGVFSESHMTYTALRDSLAPGEPGLAAMTRAAITVLERDPDGFFLLVEGGRIDHALHENRAALAIRETLEFDDAIAEARGMTGPDDLLLVTADHDHTLVVGGEAPIGNDVFTSGGVDTEGRPFPLLHFANGPGGPWPGRELMTPERMASPDFVSPAGIPLEGDTHGGMDVPLFAFGPRALVDALLATLPNTEIFGLLRDALPRP